MYVWKENKIIRARKQSMAFTGPILTKITTAQKIFLFFSEFYQNRKKDVENGVKYNLPHYVNYGFHCIHCHDTQTDRTLKCTTQIVTKYEK